MQPLVGVNWLQHQLPNSEDQREYAQQRAIIVVTEAIAEAMEVAGLNRAQVAERLGQTKGHISQVLSGRRNMTLRTLGDLLWACNVELEDIHLSALGEIACPADHAWEWYASLPKPEKAVAHQVFIDDFIGGQPVLKAVLPAYQDLTEGSSVTVASPLTVISTSDQSNADLALAA